MPKVYNFHFESEFYSSLKETVQISAKSNKEAVAILKDMANAYAKQDEPLEGFLPYSEWKDVAEAISTESTTPEGLTDGKNRILTVKNNSGKKIRISFDSE